MQQQGLYLTARTGMHGTAVSAPEHDGLPGGQAPALPGCVAHVMGMLGMRAAPKVRLRLSACHNALNFVAWMLKQSATHCILETHLLT